MLNSVIRVANYNADFLRRMLAEIPDEHMCLQPPGLPNHPAWIVGHLAYVRLAIHKQTDAVPPEYPETWIPLFGRNSTPKEDRASYPAKADLTAAFDRLHDSAVRAVSSLSAARLAGEHTIARMRAAFPTLGDLLVQMLTAHDGLHLGQLSDWRRTRGFARLL